MPGSQNRPFECRFGVGEPDGLHSSSYKVWASRSKGDVYCTARSIGGAMKISIHESGRRYWGLTREYAEKREQKGWPTPNRSRHFVRWTGGVSLRDKLTLELRIGIPTSQLRAYPVLPEDRRKVTWLPPAPEGRVLEVQLFLGPTGGTKGWPGQRAMGADLLAEGRTGAGRRLWLTHLEVPEHPPQPSDAIFERVRELVRDADICSIEDVKPTHRLHIHADYEDGGFWLCEMALDTFFQ